jgi:hypothetical protein
VLLRITKKKRPLKSKILLTAAATVRSITREEEISKRKGSSSIFH